MNVLTEKQLAAICPSLGERAVYWIGPLNDAMRIMDINTINRSAAFLAQLAHESGGLTVLEESLNYSAARLLEIFGKYFTPFEAAAYAHQEERIANRVYANRMGNGDEASGDGWKHRGFGPLMHTGKSNHLHIAQTLDLPDIAETPSLLADPDYGSAAAALYWFENGCNRYADEWNVDAVSDIINRGRVTPRVGDAIGFLDRMRLSLAARAILST